MYSFQDLEPVCCFMSSCNCCFLTCLQIYLYGNTERRHGRWSAIPISFRIFQFVVIHTVKGFSIVNEAEVDVFLELPCFLHDPMNVGSWISDPSASSKLTFYTWMFPVHMMLKSNLKDFEHNLASMWNECSCMVVWTLFGIALLWDWNEDWPFPVLWPLVKFPNLWHWVQHLNSSIFEDLK